MPRLNAAQWHDRETRILDAAEQVLVRGGFSEVSIADVARQAGVSDGLIYRYFDGKRGLRDAVLARFYRRILSATEHAIASRDSFADRLLVLVEAHLRTFRDEPALCRLFISEVRVAADYAGSPLQDLNRRYTRVLLGVLRRGIEEGALRPDTDPRLVRDMLYGGMEHVAWRNVTAGAALDVTYVSAAILQLLLHGMAAKAA